MLSRVEDLLDSWTWIFEDYRAKAVALEYQKYETRSSARPLLRFSSDAIREWKARPAVSRRIRDLETGYIN